MSGPFGRGLRPIDAEGRFLGKLHVVDLAVAAFFLGLLPVVPWGISVWKGHRELLIREITPTTLMVGKDEFLTIWGSGFDIDTVVHVGEVIRQDRVFVNEPWLKVRIPDDMPEGRHTVQVRNGRGRLAERPGAIETIWAPILEEVVRYPGILGNTLIIIRGKRFAPGARFQLDGREVEDFLHRDSTRVEALVPGELPDESHRISVINPSSLEAAWEGRIPAKALMLFGAAGGQGPLELASVRPGVVDTEGATLLLVGTGFQEGCRIFLGGVELEQVYRVTPSLLMGKIPQPFSPSVMDSGPLSVVVTRPDGQQASLAAAVSFSEHPVHLAVVLHFPRLGSKDMARFEPPPLWEITPDRYGMRPLTVVRRKPPFNWTKTGSIGLYGLLPARLRKEGPAQRLFYNGREVVPGAKLEVLIDGKEYEGEVVSTPVVMWNWTVLDKR